MMILDWVGFVECFPGCEKGRLRLETLYEKTPVSVLPVQ
jgi:hypothetical protein